MISRDDVKIAEDFKQNNAAAYKIHLTEAINCLYRAQDTKLCPEKYELEDIVDRIARLIELAK